eukprot:TRINITY_DN1194_c0_g1_i6.p1 TRINITY_DN1194_c0_g1~~TRINITY_DN1194_c0_g1_i6.p1  ORF type:complete len:227 (+),score=14.87 TRINITY_DN1194_c0_g1_i6:179-859(+)
MRTSLLVIVGFQLVAFVDAQNSSFCNAITLCARCASAGCRFCSGGTPLENGGVRCDVASQSCTPTDPQVPSIKVTNPQNCVDCGSVNGDGASCGTCVALNNGAPSALCAWCFAQGGNGGQCQTASAGCSITPASDSSMCSQAAPCGTRGDCQTCLFDAPKCSWAYTADPLQGGACVNHIATTSTGNPHYDALAQCPALPNFSGASTMVAGLLLTATTVALLAVVHL